MKRRACSRLLSVLLLPTVFLMSCSKHKPVPPENRTVRIGFSVASDDFLIERWDTDIKVFTNAARELGAEVIMAKSPGDARGQIPQIQYLLEQDIDVLVVIPEDMDMLGGIIRKITDKGIPVLSYDRPIMGAPITGYISFDNHEVGRLMAEALLNKVPQGNYLIVNGSVRDNNSYEVNRGLHSLLDESISRGDIKIVEEIWLEDWSFDEALEQVGKVLNRTTDIDAIAAGNDQLAEAAITLLAERKMAGKVAVTGQDADLVNCQRIAEGTQLMTVYKPIHRLARKAAEVAVKMARNELENPELFIDNNSGKDIPFFVETPVAVSRNQIEETIIRDGFHSREEIFRNQSGQN